MRPGAIIYTQGRQETICIGLWWKHPSKLRCARVWGRVGLKWTVCGDGRKGSLSIGHDKRVGLAYMHVDTKWVKSGC